MTINFDYSGSTAHLSAEDVDELIKGLVACLPERRYEFFQVNHESVDVAGSYDDEDGYVDIANDIEWTLSNYDVDWKGGHEPEEFEPDWDSMPRGYDACAW